MLNIWSFSASGTLDAGQVFKQANGPYLTVDQATTVVGDGMDFLGTGGRTVVLRNGDGTITIDEADLAGNL